MNETTSFRDAESISAYLDGQISLSDKAALEARLKTEPRLREILSELSESRSMLRKLPARRAPHNFTLTPKMAGVRPPLPRIFPVFRLASALAAILFFFAFSANLSAPVLSALRSAVPAPVYGMGGGGGDSRTLQEPAAAAAPQAENIVEPTVTSEFNIMQDAPTQSVEQPAATAMAVQPPPQAKIMPSAQGQPDYVEEVAPIQLPFSAALQFALLAIAVLSGSAAYLVRTRAENSWFKTHSQKPKGLSVRQLFLVVLVMILIAALATTIYLVSSATFYAPISALEGDKGAQAVTGLAASGDKGGVVPVSDQGFTLEPGLGYVFSTQISPEELIAVDFPGDVFPSGMFIVYTLGASGIPVGDEMNVGQVFSLLAADMSVVPQAAFTITLDYSDEFASKVDEASLRLYWWSGSEWQDASETCISAAPPNRQPEINRLGVIVCKLGAYILAVP